MSDETCHDCGAKPGQFHTAGCDVERCTCCLGQRISCGCRSQSRRKRERWTGEWPGKAECRELGLWCVAVPVPPHYRRYHAADEYTPGKTEDLNRLCEVHALRSTCVCR